MTVISPPAWQQAGTYPARTDRLSAITSGLWYSGFAADEATPLRPRQGVRPSFQGYQLKARAAGTPNMTVIVSGGMAFIDNHDINGYGTYVLVNDGDVTVTIAAAGGAGQFRKDSVCLSVYDAETAGAVNSAVLEVIQGPYAASAGATVRGTLPPNSIVIADVAIAPSQTSVAAGNITDVRNFTASLGGIAPIPSTIAPARPHPGQVWYQPDTDGFRYGKSDGTVADLMPAAFSGWKNLTSFGALQTGATAATSPNVPQVGDLVIGAFRQRVFRGVINLTGITTSAFTFFVWSSAYRPVTEIDGPAAATPSLVPFRYYLSTAGSWGMTGQSAGLTSINLAQFSFTDPVGAIS